MRESQNHDAELPDLTGRRVVIPGGTGSVGEGIVRAYLRAGAEAVVPTRSHARSEDLREVLGDEGWAERLRLVVADYTSIECARELADRVEAEAGAVTDVVAAIGGWWAGSPVVSTSAHAWQEYFVGFATAHLAVAQAWLPRLDAAGAYQIIVGASALFPVQGSGIVSMQQAALLMQGRTLQAEAGDSRRVFTNLLGVVNNRNRPQQRAEWISAEDVGEFAVALSSAPQPSENYQLLDRAAFEKALAGVRAGGRE